jgi:NAD-reducing hydrogenase large subunit
MHFGQVLQSHALHFFHLSSPDLLFGFDDAVAHRNIVGMIHDHPDIARQGVLLRKYGQEVIRVTCGKRIHGTGALPGGVNKSVTAAERDLLRADIGQIVDWAVGRGRADSACLHGRCRAEPQFRHGRCQ